jgi:membrane protease YdiL (CAAX protease family)
VLAAITPAIFVTIVLLVDVLTGWGRFAPGTQAPLWTVYLSSLISGVTIGAVFAFGEEYGWRGYLLPKLLPLGEFRASLLVGVIWAFWHTPALLAGLNYPGSTPRCRGVLVSFSSAELYPLAFDLARPVIWMRAEPVKAPAAEPNYVPPLDVGRKDTPRPCPGPRR